MSFRLVPAARQPAVAGALAALLLGANLAAPLYAVYRERFGFDSLVLTLVFAVYALALAPSLLLFGELSDRIGRRPVILGGLVMGTLALLLFALATSVVWLFAARIVQGVSVGMAGGAATAALVELDPLGDGRHAALLSTLAQTLGGGIAPVVTGVLAQWAPAPRVLCYVVGMVACVTAAGLLLAMPEPGRPRGGGWSVPRPSVPRDIRGAFARVAMTGAAVWAVIALFFSVVPSFASERLSTGNLAVLGAISSLALICSSIAQVASRDRVEPRIAQAVGLALLTAGLGALALASVSDHAVVLLAASVLAGTGHGLAFLGAQDDLNRIAPPERRGEINAAFYTCIYIGIAVPVIGVGVLADLSSLVTAVNVFAAVIGTAAVAAALWHVAARR
ncbi:MAG TPA: MFS transporter [Gaiellales bacterium]|nr:MFS transporter [Gaiellales bacterium]